MKWEKALKYTRKHKRMIAVMMAGVIGFACFYSADASVIKDVYIIQSHSLQALIQACQQILSASPVPVRAIPHQISRFCTDHHLVSVSTHFFPEDSAEVFLCASIYRTVIICQIKMCDSVIKCGKAHLFHILIIIYTTEIMPETKCDRRKHQTAFTAMAVKIRSFCLCISGL